MMGRLDEHRKACIEYGIYIDDKSYFAGREQGLRDYCQLDNAFRAGLNGYPYRSWMSPVLSSPHRKSMAYLPVIMRQPLSYMKTERNWIDLKASCLVENGLSTIRSFRTKIGQEFANISENWIEGVNAYGTIFIITRGGWTNCVVKPVITVEKHQ